MKSRRPVFIGCLAALIAAGCADGSFTSRVSLPLTQVDGQTLPVTLPSGTGTVQVVSGALSGSQLGTECTWVINLGTGTSRTGTVDECTISIADFTTYELDLGGPPAPSGPHTYTFGFQLD